MLTAVYSAEFDLPVCKADKSLLPSTDENSIDLDSEITFFYVWVILAEERCSSSQTPCSVSQYLYLSTVRHLLGVQFVTNLKANLYSKQLQHNRKITVLTRTHKKQLHLNLLYF